MSRRVPLVCVALALSMSATTSLQGQSPAPLTLYMPDGQLASHSIRIYVTRDIPPAAKPKLQLFGDNAVVKASSGSTDGLWEPRLVAPGQKWTEPGPDARTQVARDGTLLVFDLSSIAFDGRAMRRLMPVVKWTEGDKQHVVVGQGEVNVGSTLGAGIWTGIIVGAALLIVLVLSWIRGTRWGPVALLTGVDGHLSLAQAQVASWTIAVGSIVLAYGLVRLEIPEIPETLLVLMGASLATGGIGFFRDAQKLQAAAGGPGAPIPQVASWHLSDLLRIFTPGAGQQVGELSMAKAQMLFWTVLLIVLFVVKSVLEGVIWNVPWELVALMGFSQAGYLAPKITS